MLQSTRTLHSEVSRLAHGDGVLGPSSLKLQRAVVFEPAAVHIHLTPAQCGFASKLGGEDSAEAAFGANQCAIDTQPVHEALIDLSFPQTKRPLPLVIPPRLPRGSPMVRRHLERLPVIVRKRGSP